MRILKTWCEQKFRLWPKVHCCTFRDRLYMQMGIHQHVSDSREKSTAIKQNLQVEWRSWPPSWGKTSYHKYRINLLNLVPIVPALMHCTFHTVRSNTHLVFPLKIYDKARKNMASFSKFPLGRGLALDLLAKKSRVWMSVSLLAFQIESKNLSE